MWLKISKKRVSEGILKLASKSMRSNFLHGGTNMPFKGIKVLQAQYFNPVLGGWQ